MVLIRIHNIGHVGPEISEKIVFVLSQVAKNVVFPQLKKSLFGRNFDEGRIFYHAFFIKKTCHVS